MTRINGRLLPGLNRQFPWTNTLEPSELEEHWRRYAELAPGMAARSRTWWESRTAAQLRALKAGAWDANDADQYQLAKSYLERLEAADSASSAPAVDATPEGLQFVIPGCEKDPDRGPDQLSMF